MNQEFEKSVTNLLSRAVRGDPDSYKEESFRYEHELDFGTSKVFIKISLN